MKLDESAIGTVVDELRDLAVEFMPELATAMVRAKSDTKATGKLTLTVEIVDDPGSESRGRNNSLTVSAKVATPAVSCDQHKVVFQDGQMALL